MWDNINIIINKKRPSSHINELHMDGKHYHQPQSISNTLNQYFCNIPSLLASKLPKTNLKPVSFLSQSNHQDFTSLEFLN